MISIKKPFLLSLPLLLLALMLSNSYAIADNAVKLYKWKDTKDQWHYSKLPPDPANKEVTPTNLEVAKDGKTIIFEKKTDTAITSKTETPQLTQQQQEAQLRENCRNTQKEMMSTANYYRKTLDQKLQEKAITFDQYNKETLAIVKLEEIGGDINFFAYCLVGFIKKPQYKTVADCILASETEENRISCLQQLPPTE